MFQIRVQITTAIVCIGDFRTFWCTYLVVQKYIQTHSSTIKRLFAPDDRLSASVSVDINNLLVLRDTKYDKVFHSLKSQMPDSVVYPGIWFWP